jgi:hypothetical protein
MMILRSRARHTKPIRDGDAADFEPAVALQQVQERFVV